MRRAQFVGRSLLLVACTMVGCGPEPLNDTEPERALEVTEQAIASGCTSAQPTSIGGDVYGYPDNYSVNSTIGVHLVDADGNDVDGTGRVCDPALNNCNGTSRYAYLIRTNPTISALGVPPTTPGMTRSWMRCVSSRVARMYLEAYPRNESNLTDNTKYAGTMSNRVDIAAGSTVRYVIRYPVRYEYSATQGNTGNVNGWAKCNGVATPVTRINAWTAEPSTACGIRAYKSGGNIENSNGYWWIGPLAAGQCGATSQAVNIVAHVNCNGVDMAQTRQVNITRGDTIGAVNFYFP